MKHTIPILLAATCMAGQVTTTSGQTVIVSATAPTEDILSSGNTGTTFSRIFDEDQNANHARGQAFSLADGAGTEFQITAITIHKNGAQTFANDTMTLRIYEGPQADWDTGSGHSTADDGDDYYVGTTVAPLRTEAFTIDGAIAGNNYVTFELATPLTVNENSDFGFFFTYDQSAATSLDYFQYNENGSPGRTSITTAAHGTSPTRAMRYIVQGIIPGILDAPTITASQSLIETGGSVDLDITYDIEADAATLATPGDPAVDLIALDDGDGIVSITGESPTSTFDYVVTTTKAGQDDQSATATVKVADSSTVPTNSFSTEILTDTPLFYYRFEEPADSGFLTDISGNGYHTDNIVGTLGQGSGPGGMQNAGEFPGSVGIGVPASSDTATAYTLVAVVNSNNIQGGSKNIFSMKNGTGPGPGRSIFYLTNGVFQTYVADNAGTTIPVTTMPDSQTSFLVHCVYDPDPDGDVGTADQEMRVYIDGALEGSVTLGAVDANIGEWVLGSHKGQGYNYFDGWLDETAVFDSELSDARIAAHGAAFLAEADPLLGFVSEAAEIIIGDSVTLSWKISDAATAVEINGDPQTISGGGIYTTVLSPTTTTTYTIEVFYSGGSVTRQVEVIVLPPPTPALITSITIDDQTPPNVTINYTGAPFQVYNLRASATLDDGFPTDLGLQPATDEFGVGTTTFPGLGDAEFYRFDAP